MIDWIHNLAMDWGTYRRRNPSGWPPVNLLHRVRTEVAGAAHGGIRYDGPRVEYEQRELLYFHAAYEIAPESYKEFLDAVYVGRMNVDRCMTHLEISRREYYDRRSQVQGWLLAKLPIRGVSHV